MNTVLSPVTYETAAAKTPDDRKREGGMVKFWHDRKLFGFIVRDGGLGEVYLSREEADRLDHDPDKGERVTYMVRQATKGPIAVDVRYE